MKYIIENQTTSYANDRVSFSGSFVITDDFDVELWRKGVSSTGNINITGWYTKLKENIAAQCQEIKNLYVAKMAQVVADTGQPDIQAIIDDITTEAIGGIV